ncbi:MAG: hypothetical protein ACT4O2_03540 [Beijerinckiaceae bacterium]
MDAGYAREAKCRELVLHLRWRACFACPNRGMTGEAFEMSPAIESMPRLRARDRTDGSMDGFADRW